MLSSLSSFLPSALLQSVKGKEPTPNEEDEDEDDDASTSTSSHAHPSSSAAARKIDPSAQTDNASPRPSAQRPRRPRSDKPLNETYIIVRPPPAKNNHPLNLQIQLVPQRQQREPSTTSIATVNSARRQSGDYGAAFDDATAPPGSPPPLATSSPANSTFSQNQQQQNNDLRRVASVRSNYSDRSAITSSGTFYGAAGGSGSASVTSFSSSVTTNSSSGQGGIQRRIVPLYNLSAHNVMTNTVTDAGTDARVAKFLRRGLEIMRVGTWEPVEVWSSKSANGGMVAGHFVPAQAPPPPVQVIDGDGRLLRQTTLSSGGQQLDGSAFSMSNDRGEGSIPASPSFMRKVAAPPSPSGGGGHRRQISAVDPLVTPTQSPAVTPTASPAHQQPSSSSSGAKKFFGKVFNSNSNTAAGGGGKKKEFPFASLNVPGVGSTLSPPGSPSPSRNSFAAASASSRANAAKRLSGIFGSSSSASHSQFPSGSGQGSSSASLDLAHSNASYESHASGSSGLHPAMSHDSSHASAYGPGAAAPLQPPVLGLQASLHASHAPGATLAGRPSSYVWVLRKWAKEKQLGGNDGMLLRGLASVAQGLQISASNASSGSASRDQHAEEAHADVEVRFEWTRSKSASKEKEKARRAAGPIGLGIGLPSGSASNGNGSRRASDQSGASLRPPSIDEEPSPNHSRASSRNASKTSLHHGGQGGHSSPMTPLASTTSNSGSGHGHGPGTASKRQSMLVEPDDGEDSDAEDSETPWTCVLHIYPAHLTPLTEAEAKERERAASISHSHSSSGGSPPPSLASPDGRLRLRLAVIVPTPHHPKIIGQFKVPFPLPDVAITPRAPLVPAGSMPSSRSGSATQLQPARTGRYDPRSAGVGARFLPRTIGPDGVMRSSALSPSSGSRGSNGEEINVAQEVLLTAEDIKDVLSSTGLWLVVREGFAGLGRTKRKGDGWHIRA